jgi:hypothetical protein
MDHRAEASRSPLAMPAHTDDESIKPTGSASEVSATNAEAKGSKCSEEIGESRGSLLQDLGARAEEAAKETTALLGNSIEYVSDYVHPGPCSHGTFSPRPNSRVGSIRSGTDGNKGVSDSSGSGSGSGGRRRLLGGIADGIVLGVGKKRSTTARLAEEHGIKTSSVMYVVPTGSSTVPYTSYNSSPFYSMRGVESPRLTEAPKQVLCLLYPIFCLG